MVGINKITPSKVIRPVKPDDKKPMPTVEKKHNEEVGKSLPKDGTKDNPEGTQANHIDERI
jgi:hypothetical protein